MLSLLFGPPRKRAASVWDDAAWTPTAFAWGAAKTRAGVTVDEDVALTYSAVWCATRIIAETCAYLPLLTYRRKPNGDRELATDHPNYDLLKCKPAPNIGSMAFREGRTVDQVNGGNGFAEIQRADPADPASPAVALWPIDHRRVSAAKAGDRSLDGRPVPQGYYLVRSNDGSSVAFAPWEVLHVHGALSRDGIWGRSVIAYAKESVGFGLGVERHGANTFGSGNLPRGIVFASGLKDREARNNFREEWRELHGKPDSNNIAILPTDAKFEQLSFSNEDSQYLETRRFNIAEVARWYRIPLYHLQEYEKAATYASIEALGIEFVTYSILPWLKRWEEQINLKLFSEEEREEYFAEHLLTALLRGDSKSRYEAYQIAIGNGFMTRNEARRLENMNGLGSDGDTVFVQMNTEPLEQAVKPAAPPAVPGQPAAPAAQARPGTGDPGMMLLDVPDHRQETAYTCGACCTQMVAEFFGVGEGRAEADYASELGTTPADGTEPGRMVDWFNDHGLRTTSGPGMTLKDLGCFFRAGKPVVVPIQMYGTTEEYDAEEAQNQEGHYVIVIGVGLGQIFLQDPVAGRTMMAAEEFDRRWHDMEGDGVIDDHFGIAVCMADDGGEEDDEPPGPEEVEPMPPPEAERPGDVVGAPVEQAVVAVPPVVAQDALRGAARGVLQDVLARMYAKEANACRRVVEGKGDFDAWLSEWADRHTATLAEALAPVAALLAAVGVDGAADRLAVTVAEGSRAAMRAAYDTDTREQFAARLAEWPKRAGVVAASVLAGNLACGGPGSGVPGPCPENKPEDGGGGDKGGGSKDGGGGGGSSAKSLKEDEIDGWVDRNGGKEWRGKLSQDEARAMDRYQAGSSHLNGELRSTNPRYDSDVDARVKSMDAAIAKAEPIKDAVVVRRGLQFESAEQANAFRESAAAGKTMQDNAYVSTSLSQKYMDGFFRGNDTPENAVMEIHVPAGTKAAWMGGGNADFAHEHELLLPRGSQFKVTGVGKHGEKGMKVVAEYVGAAPREMPKAPERRPRASASAVPRASVVAAEVGGPQSEERRGRFFWRDGDLVPVGGAVAKGTK